MELDKTASDVGKYRTHMTKTVLGRNFIDSDIYISGLPTKGPAQTEKRVIRKDTVSQQQQKIRRLRIRQSVASEIEPPRFNGAKRTAAKGHGTWAHSLGVCL